MRSTDGAALVRVRGQRQLARQGLWGLGTCLVSAPVEDRDPPREGGCWCLLELKPLPQPPTPL